MRVVFAIACCAALLGCATNDVALNNEGVQAMNRGDLQSAHTKLDQAISAGNRVAFNNMGTLFLRRGDRATAVAYYTLAARWGVPEAQANLQKLGQPVPAADLLAASRQEAARRSAREAAELQRALELQSAVQDAYSQRPPYYEPTQPNRPNSIHCTTMGMNPGIIGQTGQGQQSYSTNCVAR